MLEEAVDAFIEEKKQRFPEHYKEFGTGTEHEEGKILRAKNVEVPRQEELDEEPDQEKAKEELRKRILENGQQFQDEAEERSSDIEEASDSEEKWDCESILTTYTNTDNHPGVIKTQRRVKPGQRNKIELHKQFKVPIDGLVPFAEEISLQKEKKKAAGNHPFQRVEDESEQKEETPEDEDAQELDPKKAHKK